MLLFTIKNLYNSLLKTVLTVERHNIAPVLVDMITKYLLLSTKHQDPSHINALENYVLG